MRQKNLLCTNCKYCNRCPHSGSIIRAVFNGGISIRYCQDFFSTSEIDPEEIFIEEIGKGLKKIKKTMMPLKITELEIIKNLPTINR